MTVMLWIWHDTTIKHNVFSNVTVPDAFDRYIIIKDKFSCFFQIFILAVIFGTDPILTLFYRIL